MLNPKLEPFGVLVGEWRMIGTHPLFPGAIFHGRVSFEWIEDGAFLLMRSQTEEEGIPSAIAVFGCDDSAEEASMLYSDERGIARIYETSVDGNVWRCWRNAPGFSQRFTGTFADHDNTMQGIWELCKDGSNWARDLEQTYTRIG